MSTIAARLRACENSSLLHLPAWERGLYSEWLACRHFQAQNWTLLEHRYRTPFGEFDLLFSVAEDECALVEVKSLGSEDFSCFRVSAGQKRRLARIRLHLEMTLDRKISLHLAVVSHLGEVTEYLDFLC